MKQLARKLILCLPGAAPMVVLDFLRCLRYPELRRQQREQQRVYKKLGSPRKVLQGPFKDMPYIPRAFFGSVLPKVLGTYEMELNETIEAIWRLKPDRIIDVGAAEGYYAVGLAVRNPQTQMICFEIDSTGRYLLGQLAELNNVADRLKILSACSVETLQSAVDGARQPVVICDTEGFEDQLIDPARVRGLSIATLLVEMHEFASPGVSNRIRDRFSSTHAIQVIDSRGRTAADLPLGVDLRGENIDQVLDERLFPQQWYYMTPKAGG